MYAKAQFPGQIWDGDTENPWRSSRSDNLSPNSKDWDRIVAETLATQQQVKALIEAGGSNKIGWFSCPDTIGIYQVTDVGFKPKRVALYVSKAPGTLKHTCYGMGLMDEFGNQNSMTWAEKRGDSSVNKAIHTTDEKKIVVEASHVSMDDGGFTIDFSIVNSLFIIRWDAIG